ALTGATPFARLQPYGSETWTDLQLAPVAGSDRVRIATPGAAGTPDAPEGVYRLRVGVRPADASAEPLYVDQWVSIAAKRPLGLGLFTQRGRDAFYRGESFWIALSLIAKGQPVPGGTPVEVDLIDARNQRLPLLRHKLDNEVRDRDTLVMRLHE